MDHCELGSVYGELRGDTPFYVVNGSVCLIVWMSLNVSVGQKSVASAWVCLCLPECITRWSGFSIHMLRICRALFLPSKRNIDTSGLSLSPMSALHNAIEWNVYASAEPNCRTNNVPNCSLESVASFTIVHHCVAYKLALVVLIHIADSSSINVSSVWYTQIVVANDMLRAIWWSQKQHETRSQHAAK